MNARFITVLFLAAALGTPAFTATANSTTPMGFRVKEVTSPYHAPIARGATEWMVRETLGVPTKCITPAVWLYYGFHANQELPNDPGCKILMISYANGRVADLKLINPTGAEVIATNLTRGSTVAYIVSAN